MRWRYFVFLLVLMSIYSGTAVARQITVTGQLSATSGKAVPNIAVLLKNAEGRLINFANSNAQGKYNLHIPDTTNYSLLYLEVNTIQYKLQRQKLQRHISQYNFILEEKVIELPEVKVAPKPVIRSSGDTLSYLVSSFARPEDRSIGDVLKRLPGITVGEDGQVFYNGRAIFNLYIHNDDLMDGRYGLATKTISKDMIVSIDVIQNHQPIKVLKDKVLTDNVAINLVLKNENSLKLAGQAMLGAGLPSQYDAALNLMLFNKKFKTLNSLKANNSSTDYQSDFSQLGASGFLNSLESNKPAAFLSAGTASNPDLPRTRYYINRSASVNSNVLVNIHGGLQLKANIQVFGDRNQLDYYSQVVNYLPADTIRYQEYQHAIQRPFSVNAGLTAMVNKDHYFLNNALRVQYARTRQFSNMNLNGLTFNQRLYKNLPDFSNDLVYTPALKNRNILDFRWLLKHYNSTERLAIDQGLNPSVMNEGQAYNALEQEVQLPGWLSHAYLSYRLPNTLIRQNYVLGAIVEQQDLQSLLQLTQPDGTVKPYAGDAGNQLLWQRQRYFMNAAYDFKKNRWEGSVTIPVIWQAIRYRQDAYQLDNRHRQFFINPVIRLRLKVYAEDYLQFNYGYSNNVGNIAGVYRGAVLTNYRYLVANDAGLQEKSGSGAGVQYNFQRSIIMLFINAGVHYNKIRANTIQSSILTNDVQRTILLPIANDQSSFTISSGISKFIFPIKTTTGLSMLFRRSRFDQFINTERLPFTTGSLALTGSLETQVKKRVSVSYGGTVAWNKSQQVIKTNTEQGLKTQMRRIDQQLGVTYTWKQKMFFTAKARQTYATQAAIAPINYCFADMNIRFKWAKLRTDVELDITNLTNITHYRLIQLNYNLMAQNQYNLRGRMALLRFTFNL